MRIFLLNGKTNHSENISTRLQKKKKGRDGVKTCAKKKSEGLGLATRKKNTFNAIKKKKKVSRQAYYKDHLVLQARKGGKLAPSKGAGSARSTGERLSKGKIDAFSGVYSMEN